MADLTSGDIQNGAASQELGEMSKATEQVAENTGKLQGLTDASKSLQEQVRELFDSLNDFQKELFIKLTEGDKEAKAAQEASQEALEELVPALQSGDNKEDLKSGKTSYKMTDIAKMSAKYAAGPLLIFSELRAIHEDLLKMLPNADKKAKPKELESESKGKGFKIGKISGIPDMTKALKDFAVGMLVMKLVNKKMITTAMDLVGYAVMKWNDISNNLKGNDKRWKDLNGLMELFGGGIKKLVLSLLILTLAFPLIVLAIPSALLLVGFFNIFGLLGKVSKASFKGIVNLAKAALLMSAAFGAFAVVLWFLGKFVAPNLIPALLGLAAIEIVIWETTKLGKMTKAQTRNFMMFAGGAIMMAAAYALFGFAMNLIAQVGWNFPLVLAGLGVIWYVLNNARQQGKEVGKSSKDFMMFAAGMSLLGIAYFAFGKAISILADVGVIGALKAIPGLFIIYTVIDFTKDLAQKMKECTKDFLMFAAGMAILGVAYMAFGVAINILSGINFSKIPAIAAGMGMIYLIIWGTSEIAKKIQDDMKDFIMFAVGCIVLAVAYMAFGLAIGALSLLSNQLGPAIPVLVAIFAIILLSTLVSKLVENAVVDFVIFAAGCIVLAIAYMAFGLVLNYLSSFSPQQLGMAILSIGLITVIMVASALIGAVILNTGAIVFILAFALASIALSLALMAFSGALLLLAKVGEVPPKQILQALANMGIVMMGLVGLIVPATLALLALPSLMAVGLLLPIALFPLIHATKQLSEFSDKAEGIDKSILALTHVLDFIKGVGLGVRVLVGALALMAVAPIIGAAIGALNTPLAKLAELGQKYSTEDIVNGTFGIAAVFGIFKIITIGSLLKAVTNSAILLAVAPVISMALSEMLKPVSELANLGQAYKVSDMYKGIVGIRSVVLTFALMNTLMLTKAAFSASYVGAIFGQIGNSVQSFSSAMKELSNIKNNYGEDVKTLMGMFNSPAMTGFTASLVSLGFGLSTFGMSLGTTNLIKFRIFSQALNNLSQADSAIDKLIQFSQKADAFESIANSFQSMANSFDRIASKDRKIKGIFDTLSQAKTNIDIMPESTQVAMGGTTFDPAVTDIFNIMSHWDKDGIPIKATIDEETLQIVPDSVNNRTGAIKVRNVK